MSDARKLPKRKPLPEIDRERVVREVRRRVSDADNRTPGVTVTDVNVESAGRDGAGQLMSVEVTFERTDPRAINPTSWTEAWSEPLDALIGASLDHEESVLVADEQRLRIQATNEQYDFGEEKPETVKRREDLSKRRVRHVKDRTAHLRPDSLPRDFAAAAASMAPLQTDSDVADATLPALREDLKTKASAKVASELKRFKENKNSPPGISRLSHVYRSAQRLSQSAVSAQQLGADDSITLEEVPEAIYERVPGQRNPKKQTPEQVSSDATRTTPWTTRAKRRKPIGPDWRKQRGVSDPGTKNRSVPRTPAR